MASRLFLLRRVSRAVQYSSPVYTVDVHRSCVFLRESSKLLHFSGSVSEIPFFTASRTFCSRPLNHDNDAQGPAAIDYSALLQEDEYHKIAEVTIQNLQEKFEEYGDIVQVDGFDIDYGNEVLTLKLGNLGTYVINKQTPNRQIWLSSPVSGPSRFDWDRNAQTWVYRRNKAKLYKVLESELEHLCGQPISLS